MARVLIVDDDGDMRRLIRENVELGGHEPIEAVDGDEAVELAVGERPDLIILDVNMPGFDGFEVLDILKATPATTVAEIPVVMLTSRTSALDRITGGISGAVSYVAKPFAPAELREAVQEALTGAPERQQRMQARTNALVELAELERRLVDRDAARSDRRHAELKDRGDMATPDRVPTDRLIGLSPRQREVLDAVGAAGTVTEAAAQLGVSRANVYATLRRVAHRLHLESVPELLVMARAGALRS